MVIFHSYVKLPEGKCWFWERPHLHRNLHLRFHLETQDSSCAEDAETEAQGGMFHGNKMPWIKVCGMAVLFLHLFWGIHWNWFHFCSATEKGEFQVIIKCLLPKKHETWMLNE